MKILTLTLSVILIAMLLFTGCASAGTNDGNIVKVNEDVIQTRDFSLNSDQTGLSTSARGSVYILGADGVPRNAQLVVWFEIDPDDWGGVSFCFPGCCQVSGITCSYPENDVHALPADFVATWTTADSDSEWKTEVQFGRNNDYIPTGGGSGTAVINFSLDYEANEHPETLDLLIALGSDENDGARIVYPDFMTLEIPLAPAENE